MFGISGRALKGELCQIIHTENYCLVFQRSGQREGYEVSDYPKEAKCYTRPLGHEKSCKMHELYNTNVSKVRIMIPGAAKIESCIDLSYVAVPVWLHEYLHLAYFFICFTDIEAVSCRCHDLWQACCSVLLTTEQERTVLNTDPLVRMNRAGKRLREDDHIPGRNDSPRHSHMNMVLGHFGPSDPLVGPLLTDLYQITMVWQP